MSERNDQAGTKRGSPAMAPQLPWELVRESIPAPPPQAAVMAAAARSADELRKLQRIGGRRMLRLAYALGLALVLALCGGTVFWLGGRGQHTAWASAEGYVLQYDIFDRTPTSSHEMRAGLPNELSFKQEVRDWARQSKIPLSEKGWIEAPRFVELQTAGSVSWAQKLWSQEYKLTMIGISDAERDDLIARLEPLAGVAPPVISENSEYYVSLGMPEALATNTVVINGAEYSFPKDFSEEEARALRSYFWSCRDETRYAAFSKLNRGPSSKADRFDLGDVYKIELNDDGALVITTLVKVWEEGRILKNDPLFQRRTVGRGDNGWSVAMSRALPEPGYDPLQALATWRNTQLLEQRSHDFPQSSTYQYEFFTPQRMLAAGAPKYSANEVALAQALVAKLDDTLNAFQSTHPEYWDKYVHRYRITHHYSSFGAMPVQYQIRVTDSDGELAKQVQTMLSKIPGLPEAQAEHHDLRQKRPSEIIFEPPPVDETFTMPPLPPPNPAQWHAMQGYKLEYRVLGKLGDGQPRFNETDSTREFSHAVAVWATGHGLPVNPQPEMLAQQPALGPGGAPLAAVTPNFMPFINLQFPDVALYMAEPSGCGQFGGFSEAMFTLYLAAPDNALPDSLAAALKLVPGAAAPKIEPCRFFIHDSHPNQPLTGGDLVVDGKRYRFPDDLAWEEALSLSYRGFSPGVVQYTAFFSLVDPKRNRIPFPDIARIVSMADGSTLITTYKQDWPEGRALHNAQKGYSSGATVPLLTGQAEGGYDPLPALIRQLQPRDYKAQGTTYYTLLYYIAPQDHWLAEFAAGTESAMVAQRHAVFVELDRRITVWLDAHPQYKATEAMIPRVGCYPFPYDGLYLGSSVNICGDDDTLAQELTALLASVPGLPAPVPEQQEITTF